MGQGVSEAAPIGYRPWLDGVRAIAVILVVASHTGGLSLPGLGETGVGAFFGLSGYLITGLLYDEYRRNGHVRLRDFYVRRAARLLPALFLMLIVCDALFVTAGASKVLRSSLFAASYVANYATVVSGYLPGYSQT